jgi:hypothetical protein
MSTTISLCIKFQNCLQCWHLIRESYNTKPILVCGFELKEYLAKINNTSHIYYHHIKDYTTKETLDKDKLSISDKNKLSEVENTIMKSPVINSTRISFISDTDNIPYYKIKNMFDSIVNNIWVMYSRDMNHKPIVAYCNFNEKVSDIENKQRLEFMNNLYYNKDRAFDKLLKSITKDNLSLCLIIGEGIEPSTEIYIYGSHTGPKIWNVDTYSMVVNKYES